MHKLALLIIGLLLWNATPALWSQQIPFPHQPLEGEADLSSAMVAGIHHFLQDKIKEKKQIRDQKWLRASGSTDRRVFLEDQKNILKDRLGINQGRDSIVMKLRSDNHLQPYQIEHGSIKISAVEWTVYDGVLSEGLHILPIGKSVKGQIVLIPDADQTPEGYVGLADQSIAWGRLLAEQGYEVVVLALINREATYSGNAALRRWTNQPHREWLYRQSFELGKHIIGEEVQKALAVVDWFEWKNENHQKKVPIGMMGYGEGGMLALYAGAIDDRIKATLVSGYFNQREEVWQEPIYRNTFGLLSEFGDAELALLHYPRPVIIDHSLFPNVEGPPLDSSYRKVAAPGKITTPEFEQVEEEWYRIGQYIEDWKEYYPLVKPDQPIAGISLKAINLFLQRGMGGAKISYKSGSMSEVVWVDMMERQERLVRNLENYYQQLLDTIDRERQAFFWDRLPKEDQTQTKADLRNALWKILGQLPDPAVAPRVEARVIARTDRWTRYEVKMEVWSEVFAWGYLTVPQGLEEGARYPVVVCQHGLEGLPADVVATDPTYPKYGAYKGYATLLAEQGFITFAPHNPYRGFDKFRTLQRLANPMGYSLFSVIIGQHQQILRWLQSLPFVDEARIGFYGLSYGGKSAMRIPAVLEGYALSICSGDFNEWIRKNVSVDWPYSYMYASEYEIWEWNLGRTISYAEMAALIAPRPFMVEFGYRDGIGRIEWVNYELGKVKQHYDLIKQSDHLSYDFFDGPHQINGKATFEFLEKHLKK